MTQQKADYVRFMDLPIGAKFRLIVGGQVKRMVYTKTELAEVIGSNGRKTMSDCVDSKDKPRLIASGGMPVQIDSSGTVDDEFGTDPAVPYYDPNEAALVLYEVDPDTNEALGSVHPFCSEVCRRVFAASNAPDYDGALFVEGSEDVEANFGFPPHCDECDRPIRAQINRSEAEK